MRKIHYSLFLLSVLLGVGWVAVSGTLQAQTTLPRSVLLTEEEATQLRILDLESDLHRGLESDLHQNAIRLPSAGPAIVFKRPDFLDEAATPPTLAATTPLDLLIVFEPTRAGVDMASLEVRAKKGWFTQSLTSRLQPYVAGTTLEASKLEVPPGTYRIEIAIADRSGARTVRAYYLEVQQ